MGFTQSFQYVFGAVYEGLVPTRLGAGVQVPVAGGFHFGSLVWLARRKPAHVITCAYIIYLNSTHGVRLPTYM